MNKNFYLQHSLMAMCDPRMQQLVQEETLKGLGAYWFILEKLALLPEPYANIEYLRPFCGKKQNVSCKYLEKIIREYGLFTLDSDGYFMPVELNPIRKKTEKRVGNKVEMLHLKK